MAVKLAITTIMIPNHCCISRITRFLKFASGFFLASRTSTAAFGILTSVMAVAPVRAEIHRLNQDEMALFQHISSNVGQQRTGMRLDPILCKVARQRATDMAHRNYFSHVNPDGLGANHLVRRAGFPLPREYSSSRSGNNIESLAMGTSSLREIVTLWLKSPGHRIHILGELDFYKRQSAVGVGIVSSLRPPYYRYYVILSAPPTLSLRSKPLILKNPKGKTIAISKKLADEWARISRTVTQ